MGLVDFLMARFDEELHEASCVYDTTPDGHLRCRCDRPEWEVLEMVACLELVHRWRGKPERDVLLRMLADPFSGHPDYERHWHLSEHDVLASAAPEA